MTEEQILFIAQVAHEANRKYCDLIGDTGQVPWDEAPEWQRESAVLGVRLHIDNPDTTPEGSHKSWFEHKKADGWVYGETKDPVKKEHPCMVPYSQLPITQRVKDYIFTSVVRGMVAAMEK